MLRVILEWRLLRMLFPLLLFGCAALTLTAALRAAPRTTGRGQSSLNPLPRAVGRGVKPLVSDTRQDLTHVLTAPRP